MLDTRLENCWNEIPILRTWTCLVTTGDNLLILAFHIFSNRLGFEDARIILIYYFYFAKGAGDLKILQKEIGGIQICVEIFQKNFLNAFLGVQSYIMD